MKRDYRGLGLGGELVKAALGEAKEPEIELVLLEASSLNERAIRVFERAGFKIVGRIPRGLKVDGERVDTLLMALELEERNENFL